MPLLTASGQTAISPATTQVSVAWMGWLPMRNARLASVPCDMAGWFYPCVRNSIVSSSGDMLPPSVVKVSSSVCAQFGHSILTERSPRMLHSVAGMGSIIAPQHGHWISSLIA